jgi:excisionase family DNA binding protein
VTRTLYAVPETCQRLSIGRSTLYELIADGQIKAVKIGRRTLIPHEELERYVASLPSRTGAGA